MGRNGDTSRKFDVALKLRHKATAMPKRKVAYHDESEPVQMRLYKSLKLWSMYADLEEVLKHLGLAKLLMIE